MTTEQYLADILASQALAGGGTELTALQNCRDEVESLLRNHFVRSSPTIQYGGSKAKGTMIREAYDLDIICYFVNDDAEAGETLEEIYNNTRKALEEAYLVLPKSSALRLQDKTAVSRGTDYHINVVPGRFTDDSKGDAFLYLSAGDKKRLKTNLDIHVRHVKDVVSPMRFDLSNCGRSGMASTSRLLFSSF